MGCLFSKCSNRDELKIKIIDCTPPGAFDYLRPYDTISLSVDTKCNISAVDIRFEGWYHNCVCLWPCHTEDRKHFLQLQRTPLQTPSISSDDSDYDTVFQLNNNKKRLRIICPSTLEKGSHSTQYFCLIHVLK